VTQFVTGLRDRVATGRIAADIIGSTLIPGTAPAALA
jgi:hypothetical protein